MTSNNNNNNSLSSHEFYESLRAIGDFLVENRSKTDYVLSCFFQQDNIDIEEMSKAESNFTQATKFELRMNSKREYVEQIKSELSNFKHEKFKNRVAEFLYWLIFVLDTPKAFECKFPHDLKQALVNVKRFENDVVLMAGDVNRKFKSISTSKTQPPL